MTKNLFPHLHYNDLHHHYQQILAAHPYITNLQKSDILTDQDVCKYLQISVKTLRKFCRENKISYTRLGSRYYYIRQIFALNLIKICND
ncbi:hypothetical protein CBW16_11655 [Flavobacteriaceae bacterium JJC]|nr:hypothetical protein CBW16_11655 [Flavobacteriaceae bacterium JJC]